MVSCLDIHTWGRLNVDTCVASQDKDIWVNSTITISIDNACKVRVKKVSFSIVPIESRSVNSGGLDENDINYMNLFTIFALDDERDIQTSYL